MTSEAVNLLRRLGSGVIPDGASPAVFGSPIEGMDFPTLLVGAERGMIRTGRIVDIRAALEPELDSEQLENLADAADLARAAGVTSVVVTIDRRALLLDAPARQITGEIPLDAPSKRPGDVLIGLDAIVVARSKAAPAPNDDENETTSVTTCDVGRLSRMSSNDAISAREFAATPPDSSR